jgi:hypothetical protein
MASANPYGIEQWALYFSTVTAGATPAAANRVGQFRGEPSVNVTEAQQLWRGQNRFASNVLFHDGEATMTVPGFSFDSSEVLGKFWNATTGATTTHGGSYSGTKQTLSKNTRPLVGEWLLEGLNTDDGKVVQWRAHKGFITTIHPSGPRTDFAAMDLNITLLADAGGDLLSFHKAD